MSPRPQADVSFIGASVLLLLLAVAGWGAWAVHTIARGGYENGEFSTFIPDPIGMYSYIAVLVLFTAGQIVVHELGYAAAGLSRGLAWEKWGIRLSGTPNVRLGGRPKTHFDQLIVSLAGPAAEAAYGTALLAVNGWLGLPGWSPVSVAAWYAIAVGAIGLLVPLKRSSDSHRFHRCSWAVLAGRGRLPHLGA